MRHTSFIAAAVLALASSAFAQDPPTLPLPTDPVEIGRSANDGTWFGTFDFGARATSVEGDEARFMRYRDLRPGLYGTNGMIGRRTADWAIEGHAWNVGYRDQRYQLGVERVGRLNAQFLWDQIPLYISNDTSTLYTQTAPGVFRLEDLMQQEIQAGTKTLRAFEDQATQFQMRTMRRIAEADIKLQTDKDSDIQVLFRNTSREGEIPFGATFGFNNAVELPAPIDYRTTDVRTSFEWGNNTGMLRVGWDGSSFDNHVETVVWDNPLRYGPDISGAPSQGRMSLWPGNTLTYLHGTGAVTLPWRGRLTGYVAIGQGRSNEDLLPFTINSAVIQPELARPTAQAESNMTITQFTLSMRPARLFRLKAKYRYADMDIDTPIFERTTGSVSYDSSYTATAGPSEYHSVRRANFDLEGGIDIAPYTTLNVGYSHVGVDYVHRLWEKTAEDVYRVSLDTTGNQLFSVRALYEDRRREGEHFEPEALVEVGELLGMRHFDVANRNRQRFTLIANAMPGGMFGFTASAGIGRDEYPDSAHGLQFYDSDQYSVGVSIAPDDRYNFTGSYGWENYQSLQRSRNANSAAEQLNPLRDWSTDYTGKVNFLEASLEVSAIERTLIRLSADWNKSNDTYLYGLVTGSPLAVPEQLPPVKNEMTRAEIDVSYDLGRNLRLGVAYWFDDYKVEDFALGPTTLTGIALPPVQEGQPVVATNALLLGYLYRPYTAHVGFVRLTYGF